MPHKSRFETIFMKLLNFITLGNVYRQIGLFITPYENTIQVKLMRYRTIRGQSEAGIIELENGFYSSIPEGEKQYVVINGKQGAIFGYDDNSLWNIKIDDKEKVIKMLAKIDTEKFLLFQTYRDIKNRFDSKVEQYKATMITLTLLGIMMIAGLALTYILWDNYNKLEDKRNTTLSTIEKLYQLELRKLAIEYNITLNESTDEKSNKMSDFFDLFPLNATSKK